MGSLMPIILLLVVGIAIYAWYKKRKENKNANPFLSSRKNKDEVWKTIKQFLRDNGEQGKEIVDSYVVKRSHEDQIDPNGSYQYKKNKNFEVKLRKLQRDRINKKNAAQNKSKIKPPKARDLFVVVFTTKDSKTGELDAPRCFECEVINTKISKKEYDRKIVINSVCDYEKEMEWIAPVKAAEQAKAEAMEKRIAKQKESQAKRDKKRLEREQRKALKNANRKNKK